MKTISLWSLGPDNNTVITFPLGEGILHCGEEVFIGDTLSVTKEGSG